MSKNSNQMRVKLNKVDFKQSRFRYTDKPAPNNNFYISAEDIYALRVCESCYAELYGKWYYPSYGYSIRIDKSSLPDSVICDAEKRFQAANNDLKVIYKDILRVISMDTCPVCGKSFKGNYESVNLRNGDFITDFSKVASGAIFPKSKWELTNSFNLAVDYRYGDVFEECFRLKRKDVCKSNQIEAIEIVEQKSSEYDVATTIFNSSEFSIDNANALKKYLSQLCDSEKNIYALKERLKSLYAEYLVSSRLALVDEFRIKHGKTNDLDHINGEIDSITERIHTFNSEPEFTFVDFKDDSIRKPGKPIMPIEPELKIAGLFNKKKVAEENALAMRVYEQKMQIYREECEAYRRDLEKYESDLKAKFEEAVAIHKMKAEKELQSLKERKEQLLCDRERAEAALDVVIVPEKEVTQLLETEIKEAEELLKKFYEHRNQLYAYDVVYFKYRDLVALSSFYDYLASGRCTALEGPDGAYNLYEQECRANMVISQLSQVIDSLEQIKNNQFMIYQQLHSINYSLNSLNNKMDQAVKSLRKVEDNTKNIADNTKVIAYNTERTAYYSKLNAELTNSLGYMMALK